MLKKGIFLFCLFSLLSVKAQEVRVPVDLRQHNLTEYNASVFNPVLSYYGDNSQSIALWSRWQWQQVDADPTTLFLNYSRKLSNESTAGLGFFQHNTGVYVNTGGLLNYNYIYQISDGFQIGVGLNLFGFRQVIADTRFAVDPDFPLPQASTTNDFILQAAPGLLFRWKNLQLGITSENLFDYNFARNERQSSPNERITLISGGYDFRLFSDKSVLRPLLYWKSIPFQDDQYGFSALFSTDKYWAQAGYNNFYGASVGVGGRFLKKVSIGALAEFATDASLDGRDTTFEIIAAFQFGKQQSDEKEVPIKAEELIVKTEGDDKKEGKLEVEVAKNDKESKAEERKRMKELQRQEKEAIEVAMREAKEKKEAIAQKAETDKKLQIDEELVRQNRTDSLKFIQIAEKRDSEQRKMDSLASLSAERIQRAKLAAAAQKRLDSVNRISLEKQEALARQQQIDSIENLALAEAREKEQKQIDFLANSNAERIRRKEAAVAAQRRLDSIASLVTKQKVVETSSVKEEVVLEENEKYEEVKTEDGLKPGFYLIANVFGTKKYYTAFMEKLEKSGLSPRSFLRSLNNYQYVYLERYDTMTEARKARNSKFFGKYSDKIWIFRVVGQ